MTARLPRLTARVLKFMRQKQLIPPGSAVVAAVSGGADSMALLHMLFTLRDKLDIQLHAATFDHGLRGDASAADADFVRQRAESWGIPVMVGQAALDASAAGTEARARTARYTFLAEIAQGIGADLIATGHHANDQAETVLLHLIRGSGLHGMAGLRPHAPYPLPQYHPPLMLVRPLLGVTRAEIEQYCDAQSIPYRHDATNDLPDTLRNRVRLETLPHLTELNPRMIETLNRLADITAVEDDFVQDMLMMQVTVYEQASERGVMLARRRYRELPPALRLRWLMDVATRLLDPARASDKTAGWIHLQSADDVMMNSATGAVAQLPGFIQVRLGRQHVIVERADSEHEDGEHEDGEQGRGNENPG